jgi:uncharacterized membrane protein (DUF4010 family)
MDVDQTLMRLAVALGIGLLIGLERGWKLREVAPGRRAAGVRTFALCGLLGGLIAALAQATGSPAGAGIVLGFGFAIYALVFAMFQRDANHAAGNYSATTIFAALTTFILGAYAVMGDLRVAAAAGVATAGLLAGREEFHGLVARITWPELRSALILLAMTFIILPVVPDTPFGPGDGVNLRAVWLIAITLAGVSFFGYIAVKRFGVTRGILIAAFAGGLVSSTALTLTNARRAAAGEGAPLLLAAGVAIASAVSFVRVMVIIAALQPSMLGLIVPPLAAAIVVAVGYALISVYGRAHGSTASDAPSGFRNPFSFGSVIGFALLLGIVILAGREIAARFGAGGALLGAAGLGLADVDAVTVAMARLVPEPLSIMAASLAVLAAIATNTLSKLAIAAGIGRGRFAVEVAILTGACWLAAALALWVVLAAGGS